MVTSCFITPKSGHQSIPSHNSTIFMTVSLCSSCSLSLSHLCFSWLLLLCFYCSLFLFSLCLTSLLFRRAPHCVRELFIVTISWCGLSSIQFLLTLPFPFRGISYLLCIECKEPCIFFLNGLAMGKHISWPRPVRQV